MKNLSFMICADAHLDSDFARDCSLRREEQRLAFERALSMIGEYGIEYMLIPGDLFDKRCPSRETVSYVKKRFAELRHTKILIAPGEHDPLTVDSPYYEKDWPDNVYIFPSKKLSMIEFEARGKGGPSGRRGELLFRSDPQEGERKGVRFYGAAFEGHFARESLLLDENGQLPALSPKYHNILVMHGEAGVTRSACNPLPEEALQHGGFDLCALGHRHGYLKKDRYIYSGVLCSRGFEEEGDCGVVLGEITDDGRLLTEFMPINIRKYETVELDVTEADDLSVDGLSAMISAATDHTLCCRVVLRGAVRPGERIPLDGVQMRLTGNYPMIRIEDETTVEANFRLIAGENSLRGLFVKRLLELQREPKEEEKPKYSRKNMEDALRIGLKVFDGSL